LNKKWIFSFLIISVFSFSQDANWELWSKVEYRYKINKHNSFSVESSARYDFNPILFSKQFLDFSSLYKINKKFSMEIGSRFTKSPAKKSFGQRLYFSILYKPNFKKFKLSLRSRLFSEKNVVSYHRQYFRNKISLGYKFVQFLNPYLEAEYLYGINNLSENKVRFGIGNQFEFSNSIDLKIFFRIQNQDQRIIGLYISKKV